MLQTNLMWKINIAFVLETTCSDIEDVVTGNCKFTDGNSTNSIILGVYLYYDE